MMWKPPVRGTWASIADADLIAKLHKGDVQYGNEVIAEALARLLERLPGTLAPRREP